MSISTGFPTNFIFIFIFMLLIFLAVSACSYCHLKAHLFRIIKQFSKGCKTHWLDYAEDEALQL